MINDTHFLVGDPPSWTGDGVHLPDQLSLPALVDANHELYHTAHSLQWNVKALELEGAEARGHTNIAGCVVISYSAHC